MGIMTKGMTETAVCKCGQALGDHSEMPLRSRDSLGRRVTCFMFQPAEPSPAVSEAQTVPIPEDLKEAYDYCFDYSRPSHPPFDKPFIRDLIERIARLESSLAHEQIAKLRALGQLQTAQEALARAEATIAELEASLRKRAEDEYCTYVSAMKRPECLGWKQKVKEGIFGETELRGHTAAAIHLGRHQAFAEAIARATGKES